MTYCALCGLTYTHWQGCTETGRRPHAWSYNAASLFAAMVEAKRAEQHHNVTPVCENVGTPTYSGATVQFLVGPAARGPLEAVEVLPNG